ncbi:CRISPR type III-B/RAMP module RAMP protein Cmr1 [Thioflavicoccus mobilis 8321]|uniref:CRISPR type III-B/RAMP module RAMP protein Cmr1 n=1 Tax=Thioflavicoccus mobilis 8321 TaxID=765912 RepID=L0GV63_9GAMM|nr:type III-B CRISPR module RAMP protein Cmr1 [Thioflavicoccus mobilis]AGA89189.1 CRISPR type III-B/RAMP module RAMP protein Cmr1 [Thioflavicoccus mobilis 8321]
MRRSPSKHIAGANGAAETAGEDCAGRPPKETRRLTMVFPLESQTPIVGGGADALTSDAIDPVRLPSIRGQLRFWWRALGTERTADELFENESALWGGVDIPPKTESRVPARLDQAGTSSNSPPQPDAKKSLIRLDVQVERAGHEAPAGWHRRLDNGQFRALPEWDDGPSFGYGLFPLQRSREERKEAHDAGQGRLGTKTVRAGLRFKLSVAIDDPSTNRLSDPDLNRIVAALWAWIHFGGLGARTTRGFGALALREKVTLAGRGSDALGATWGPLFAPCPADARVFAKRLARFKETAKIGHEAAQQDWPVLHGARFMVARACERSAHDAHRALLGALREFRQGPGLGRAAGSQGRPSRSNWPEADALRRLAGGAKFKVHPPRGPCKTAPAAPRAAFGLPLNIGFKDREDEQANGRVVVDGTHDRYTSPVRLCPIACEKGTALPVVLWLRPGLQTVKLELTSEDEGDLSPEKVTIQSVAGAQQPIAKYLGAAEPEGDAVDAWCKWLESSKGWERL